MFPNWTGMVASTVAIPVWRPQFFFVFCFVLFVHAAAQPIEDQASRLVIPLGDQSPGSSTGSMSGNCEY